MKKLNLEEFNEIEQQVKFAAMDPLNKWNHAQLLFATACDFYEDFVKLMHTNKDCFLSAENVHRFVKEILTEEAYRDVAPFYKQKPL